MSVNKAKPHIHVLPEDDANRQLVNGFLLELSTCQIRVLPEAGGWTKVLKQFKSVHVPELKNHQERLMVLLIDFDGKEDRINKAKKVIPPQLIDRVFVLGAWKEPEDLKKAKLGTFETIRQKLAKDCREDTRTTWGHELLRHNASELDRMSASIRPILFAPA
jgi:hypothetical protein